MMPQTLRTSRRPVAIGAIALMVGAASCDNPFGKKDDPIVCTDEARPGIQLSIVDSVSGTKDGLTGVWARAVDGAYRDSTTWDVGVSQSTGIVMALAYERAGTYAVTVHANGYQDWNKSGVVVGRDECHVTIVQLTARLVK